MQSKIHDNNIKFAIDSYWSFTLIINTWYHTLLFTYIEFENIHPWMKILNFNISVSFRVKNEKYGSSIFLETIVWWRACEIDGTRLNNALWNFCIRISYWIVIDSFL